MVAGRLGGLVLLFALTGCECSEVEIEDGSGGSAGAKPFKGETCDEICIERHRRWSCDLELCRTGCTPEFQAKLAAIGCTQIQLDWMNCTLEVGHDCSDGCNREAGFQWNECTEALYATGSVTSGAGGSN